MANEIFSMLVYGIGALVFGLVGIVGFGWLLGVQNRMGKWLTAMVFPLIIFAISVGSILSARNFQVDDMADVFAGGAANSGKVVWFFRLMTATILGICLARLLSVSQTLENRGTEGRMLFFAFLFYYVTNVVLNNIFGTNPVFHDRFLPAVLIFTAMYFSRKQDRDSVVEATKWAMLVFLIASCVIAAVAPAIALQVNYYVGYVPGLTVRLWGLASNPNSLGPMAILFTLLVTYKPFRSGLLQVASLALGLGTLVLTQSKTAWIAALVAFFIVWWTRNISSPTSGVYRNASYYAPRNFALPIVFCIAGLALIAGLAILSAFSHEFAAIDDELQISSLTGRTQIWAAAIDAWQSNLLFGYGSNAWGPEFRRMIGIDAALSAHSQFMQSLSEAGLVGVIGLLFYVIILFARSYAVNRETRGLSLALFSIIFVQAISETPFDTTNLFNGAFLMHLLLFRLVLVKKAMPVATSQLLLGWQPPRQPQPQLQWSRT